MLKAPNPCAKIAPTPLTEVPCQAYTILEALRWFLVSSICLSNMSLRDLSI
uniref:Uncharacterized protein n=1 Tax=Rhizophora mucronata TaxID=61149 RepID=A0A2P2QH49_RHIMU